MIDTSKGRYWDRPWSLVDGCTPCSLGCDHCWSAAMTGRFDHDLVRYPMPLTHKGKFIGKILTHPERLDIPLKRKKPTVYAVWNDLFHEAVPDEFITSAYMTIYTQTRHTFLILTKRPERMADRVNKMYLDTFTRIPHAAGTENTYHGLTVCNQAEAAAKIPVFLQVPGKKFLSIEPCLGEIGLIDNIVHIPSRDEFYESTMIQGFDAVILGCETGPGARPMHLSWVRSVRDQCQSARVPFFLKFLNEKDGRILDGREWNDLPWR